MTDPLDKDPTQRKEEAPDEETTQPAANQPDKNDDTGAQTDAPQTPEEAKKWLSGALKRARLETGRDLGDLAYEINIPQSTLNDLEAGTLYDRMTKVFVRGYILSYAKILKLEETKLLALLDQVYAPTGEATTKRSSAAGLPDGELGGRSFITTYESSSVAKKKRTAMMNVFFPIALCLLVLGAAVYWKIFVDSGEELTEESILLELNAAATQLQEEAEEAPPAIANLTEETQPEVNVSDDTLLEFIFTEESWLEVSDSLGEEITWQIYGPGEKVAFRGTPPYRIVVGNAPGTLVRYGGRELALDPYTRNKVARIQVPLSPP